VWVIVLVVILGMALLFGIGFAASLLIRGSGTPQAEVAPSASAVASAAPLPCETTLVTPAEVLPVTGKVTVNVLNSTKRQGLARSTADVLTARGMKVKKVGNASGDGVIEGVAELRYGPKGEKAARLLEFYFPGAELVPIDRKTKIVDVVLGTEYEKVLGEAQIAAALASPSPSASGPGCASSAPVAPAVTAPSGPPSPTP
jgi:hypothetical protein